MLLEVKIQCISFRLWAINKKIFKNLPHTSYGKDCLFERLLKLKNLKILSLGLGTGWAPFFHYVENLANVPYRFKKTIQEDYFLIIN